MRIFDTAGMRKKAKVQEKLEKLSVSDGLRAVKFAEVVVVLLDVGIPFEQQDLRIADLAERLCHAGENTPARFCGDDVVPGRRGAKARPEQRGQYDRDAEPCKDRHALCGRLIGDNDAD